ncbi:MAG: LAGLIDADG family homing endonuclease [Candidatus Bathyarchaeia archaeon]
MNKRITASQISEIKRLSKAGYSLVALSKKFTMGKSTIYYHAKICCQKMSKFDAGLLNDEERGYILGIFLGDGSFNKGKKNPRFFVRFTLDAKRDVDIAFQLVNIFKKAGKKIRLISYKSNIIAKTCSKELVNYVKEYINYNEGCKSLESLKNLSENFEYDFIAGLIDSDGHVHEHLGTEIKTVSKQISDRVLEILNELGMPAEIKIRNPPNNSFSNRPRFEIYMRSRDIKQHKNKIPSVKINRYSTKFPRPEKD